MSCVGTSSHRRSSTILFLLIFIFVFDNIQIERKKKRRQTFILLNFLLIFTLREKLHVNEKFRFETFKFLQFKFDHQFLKILRIKKIFL